MFLDRPGGFITNHDERRLNDNRKIRQWQILLELLDVRCEIGVGEACRLRRSFVHAWIRLVLRIWRRIRTINKDQPRENERRQQHDLESSKHGNGREL